MSFTQRYNKNTGDFIYLPTIEACSFFKINRLPAAYGNNSTTGVKTLNDPNGPNSAPIPDYLLALGAGSPGPQFSTFGTTPFFNSKLSMSTPSVNTRDIVMEVLGNSPYTIKTQTSASGVTTSSYTYSGQSSTPDYIISFSPTNPDGSPFELEIAHEHEWGTQSDIFSSILRAGAQLVGQADDFIQKVKTIGNTTGNNKSGFKQLPNRRFDLAETYSTTTKQHVNIPFTLFTPGGMGQSGENFLRDILDPITLITSISYPKRDNTLGQGVTGQLANLVAASATGTQQKDSSALNAVNALNPGFRVFVADPPSYVNVYHQGGLFSYKNCYIKKFTYKLKSFVDGLGSPAKNISVNPSSGLAGIFQAVSANANLAYPVIAECNLEIATTEPLFSDDFVALSDDRTNASQTTGGLTTVVNASRSQNTFQNQPS